MHKPLLRHGNAIHWLNGVDDATVVATGANVGDNVVATTIPPALVRLNVLIAI